MAHTEEDQTNQTNRKEKAQNRKYNMSTNWAAVEVARFCRETGRTVPKTIQVETFDFAHGSKDREEFARWAETNKEWQHLRKEFGDYGEKPGTEDKMWESRLAQPHLH